MIKVMVVDDQRLFRDGLSTIIGLEKDIEVISVASNGRDAFDKAVEHNPDVVLLDIRMPILDGIEGTRLLRRHLPDVKVLILSTFDDSELILMALEQGAHGYLLKEMPSETIISAIHTVYLGGTVLQPKITKLLLEDRKKLQENKPATDSTSTYPHQLMKQLSEREIEVLQLLGCGMNNKEIAENLVITEGTVKNHVSNIISKLDFRDRTQAAIFAVSQGIVKSGL